ncbi:hypothetical protein [Burkholderia cepacia]|uniref:hypothetical protein n=1 Tax=Burkholderia cepacia TaxID=292 RepID=UPI002AB6747A|nr:hypothetical protein [Burkholderia cepacia]
MSIITNEFVVVSANRARAENVSGFWSMDGGWSDVEHASRFSMAEREAFDLVATGADDCRWAVSVGETTPAIETSLAMRDLARAVARDLRGIGRSSAFDSSVDVLVDRASHGEHEVLWEISRQLREHLKGVSDRARIHAERVLRRIEGTSIDSDDEIRALGVATITAVGSENVYLVKDAAEYYFKPACNRGFDVGIHDFSNEPSPHSGACALTDGVRRHRALNGGLPGSRELAERYPARGSMPLETVRLLYAIRALEISRLAGVPVIGIRHLEHLDRGARFAVADTLLARCDDSARQRLQVDEHPHVRSAAARSTGAPRLAGA